MISENSLDRYILEVDLEYPDKLHELHNDYPLVYDIKIAGVNKLVPNLGNKSKCILYHKKLQLYLSLGMKLVSVHRILKFKQSDWLKYTDFNLTK